MWKLIVSQVSVHNPNYNKWLPKEDLIQTWPKEHSSLAKWRNLETDERKRSCSKMFLSQEVNKVISSLKNSKAKDVFGLDSTFLKNYKESLIGPIT